MTDLTATVLHLLHAASPEGDVLRAVCVCGFPTSGGARASQCSALAALTNAGERVAFMHRVWNETARYFVHKVELRPLMRVQLRYAGQTIQGELVGVEEHDDGFVVAAAVPVPVHDAVPGSTPTGDTFVVIKARQFDPELRASGSWALPLTA